MRYARPSLCGMLSLSRGFAYCFYEAMLNTIAHDGVEHAGYLAFIILLSIFPSLMFTTAVVSSLSSFFFVQSFWQRTVDFFFGGMPIEVVDGILPRLKEIIFGPPQSLLTFAIAGIVWTASSSVEAMRTILNRAYRVDTPPPYIFRRMMSILQFLSIVVCVLASMFFVLVLPDVFPFLARGFAELRYWSVMFMLFSGTTALYFVLPNTKLKLFSVAPGALLAVLMWAVCADLLVRYILIFHQLNLVYGGLAGIVVSLVFFYIVSLVFIYCAEFNHSLSRFVGDVLQQNF